MRRRGSGQGRGGGGAREAREARAGRRFGQGAVEAARGRRGAVGRSDTGGRPVGALREARWRRRAGGRPVGASDTGGRPRGGGAGFGHGPVGQRGAAPDTGAAEAGTGRMRRRLGHGAFMARHGGSAAPGSQSGCGTWRLGH